MELMNRLDRLDHLRFIAALLVVLWHCTPAVLPAHPLDQYPIFALFFQGYTGVSVFCTLSGFLFAWIYHDQPMIVSSFARKRAFRILPLFLFMLAVAFGADPSADLVKTIIGVVSTFGIQLPSLVSPGWTILIEIQFYILLPFLIVFLGRYGVGYLIAFVLMLVGIRYLIWYGSAPVQGLAYLTIIGRLDQFLCGMIAATLFLRWHPLSDGKRALLVGTGLASCALILVTYLDLWQQGGYFKTPNSRTWVYLSTLDGLCYAGIIVGYLAMPSIPGLGIVSRVFSHGGRVSYSIYLTHMMVIPCFAKAVRAYSINSSELLNQVLIFFALVVCATAVASVTYYLIELPMMTLGRKRLSDLPNTVGGEHGGGIRTASNSG
jgi:peptidoglycan/LPS O-acetylase OafA/YrhL